MNCCRAFLTFGFLLLLLGCAAGPLQPSTLYGPGPGAKQWRLQAGRPRGRSPAYFPMSAPPQWRPARCCASKRTAQPPRSGAVATPAIHVAHDGSVLDGPPDALNLLDPDIPLARRSSDRLIGLGSKADRSCADLRSCRAPSRPRHGRDGVEGLGQAAVHPNLGTSPGRVPRDRRSGHRPRRVEAREGERGEAWICSLARPPHPPGSRGRPHDRVGTHATGGGRPGFGSATKRHGCISNPCFPRSGCMARRNSPRSFNDLSRH